MAALSSIGFETYDQFMVHCLRAEIASRNEALGDRVDGGGHVDSRRIVGVFGELGHLDALEQQAAEQARFLAGVSRAINRIALNSNICAAKMEERGRALGALSDQASVISSDLAAEVDVLSAEQVKLTKNLVATSFQVSFATLVAEMNACFRLQAIACRLTEEQQVATYAATCEQLAAMLSSALSDALAESLRGTEHLKRSLHAFNLITERFARILLTTRVNYVIGRSVAASLDGGEQYSNLLEEMTAVSEDARDKLDALRTAVVTVDQVVQGWKLESQAA